MKLISYRPPRGKFSHIAMFRIGSLLFIPAYLSVVLYRNFATEGPGNNFFVMTGKTIPFAGTELLNRWIALVISTAIRFCANTFTYTAVSILLNYSECMLYVVNVDSYLFSEPAFDCGLGQWVGSEHCLARPFLWSCECRELYWIQADQFCFY
jgi:hypothetical protein